MVPIACRDCARVTTQPPVLGYLVEVRGKPYVVAGNARFPSGILTCWLCGYELHLQFRSKSYNEAFNEVTVPIS
jgi:hypothetical protein